MKRRPLNPAFKGAAVHQTNDISDALLGQARRSGHLNLSNRQLTEVPKKVWNVNIDVPPEAKNVSLDSKNERWWEQVDLTKLILASNQLAALPEDIINLPALETLDFHDNELKSVAREIGSLENLRRLNLSHNKLECLPPDVGYLSNLCSLKLQHNSLDSVMDWLGKLIHLEELDLSHNKITSLPPDILNLGSLRHLDLSNNGIERLPEEIGGIKWLEDVNISSNKLTDLPKGIGNAKSLKRLDCRKNNVASFPSLSGCSSLKELYLGNNKISKMEDMSGCPALVILDLRDNNIDQVPDEITVLTKLERIDLSNNNISGLPFAMGTMENLKAIGLDGNPLKKLRRDIVQRGPQAILKYLKSRIAEEEKPLSGTSDQVDNKVPAFSSASESTDIDQHTLNQTKALNYSNKGLSEIPHQIIEAVGSAKVTNVNLSKNRLSTLPNGFQELTTCLSDLNLGFNKFQSLQNFLGDFKSLQFLDLRNNQLIDLPESMAALVSLRQITLSFNRFNNLPSVLYSITSIETILASDNKIVEIDVDGLMRLTALETVDLQNNSISQVPPQLGNLTKLRVLNLGGNSFRNPRAAILAKGTPFLLEYLRSRIPT